MPLLVLVPTAAEPLGAAGRPAVGRLASVSTLLMIVGLPNRPLTAGNGGRGRGMPRRPSMLWIRAVSSPHTNAPAPILMMTCRLKSAAQDVVAQQAVGLGLGDGRLQPLDGQRILGADVDVGLRGADAVGGDGHAFDQPVRIALDDGPVHERPGIAFVGVADQVFLVAGRLRGRTSISCRWGNRRRRGRAARSARPCRTPRRASSRASTLASAW